MSRIKDIFKWLIRTRNQTVTFEHSAIINRDTSNVTIDADLVLITGTDNYGSFGVIADLISQYYQIYYKYVDVTCSFTHTNVGQSTYDSWDQPINDTYYVRIDVCCSKRLNTCCDVTLGQWIVRQLSDTK